MVQAALSAHGSMRAAVPVLVIADDNMHYRSMRYEVRLWPCTEILCVFVSARLGARGKKDLPAICEMQLRLVLTMLHLNGIPGL